MAWSRSQKRAALGAGFAIGGFLTWYFWPRKGSGTGKVIKSQDIDVNVLSPTFGLPIGAPSPDVSVPAGTSPAVADAILRSNAAIAAYDAAHSDDSTTADSGGQ